MKQEDKLADIIYISLPYSESRTIGDFELDPAILLPIDRGSTTEDWTPEHLSWEMIISGMLKVLAYDPGHEDAAYYRQFIGAAKPGLALELTEAAIIKARNSDHGLAEEIFLAVLGLEPANCRFLLNLALLYEDMARSHQNLEHFDQQDVYEDKARTWYRRALSLDEVIPEAYLYAGHFFMRHQETEDARRQFESFLALAPDSDQASQVKDILGKLELQSSSDKNFKQAYEAIRSGQEDAGIGLIQDFLKDNPAVWNAWFLLGWGLRKKGSFVLALEAFDKAISLGGNNPDTLNEAAICAMELGKFADAQAKLDQALRLEPQNTKIISNMGILALKEGNTPQAITLFETVLVFEPGDTIAAKYLEVLRQ